MNTKLSAALVIAAVLAVAGCSSTSTPTSNVTTFPPTIPTLRDVVIQAGCTEYTPATEVGTKDGGTCKVGGHDLYIYTFGDDSARDNWLKAAKAAGALGSFQQGTSWVIQTL